MWRVTMVTNPAYFGARILFDQGTIAAKFYFVWPKQSFGDRRSQAGALELWERVERKLLVYVYAAFFGPIALVFCP